MSFYPDDLPVPAGFRTETLLARPLLASDVALDYEAVVDSRELLRLGASGAWTSDDFTIEQNLADLQMHERDHLARTSFTFTVMNPAETRCLGCIYINPLDSLVQRLTEVPPALTALPQLSARARFWMRPACVEAELDRELLRRLLAWFRQEWTFSQVVFPANQYERRQLQLYQEAGLPLIATATLKDVIYIYAAPNQNA